MKKESKKNDKNSGIIIQLLIGGVIGLCATVFIFEKIDSNDLTLEKTLLVVIFFLIATFVNINIHEFGHYIFGKLFGYRLLSYRIGFLTWNNENGKLKFSIIKNKGYGGLCAMIPPEQELTAFKQVVFYAGGIVFNVMTGVIFLLPFLFFSNLSENLNLFLMILGLFALVSGVINAIPFFSVNLPTDGKIIWSIIFKKPIAKQLIEANKIGAQLSAGIRPRDLRFSDQSNFENPDMFDMAIILFSYFKALDANDDERMHHYAELLEQNIDAIPHPSLPAIYYELCYISCISNNQEKAQTYYKKGGKILQNDKDVNGLRVKAYFEYYMNNDESRANSLCDYAVTVADKFPIKGQGIMELALVNSLKKRLDTHSDEIDVC